MPCVSSTFTRLQPKFIPHLFFQFHDLSEHQHFSSISGISFPIRYFIHIQCITSNLQESQKQPYLILSIPTFPFRTSPNCQMKNSPHHPSPNLIPEKPPWSTFPCPSNTGFKKTRPFPHNIWRTARILPSRSPRVLFNGKGLTSATLTQQSAEGADSVASCLGHYPLNQIHHSPTRKTPNPSQTPLPPRALGYAAVRSRHICL